MKKRAYMAAVFAAAFILLASGCGYSFRGAQGTPPGGVRRLTIPQAENATTYSNLTRILTNEVTREFIFYQDLEVTPESAAQAVLELKILNVSTESAARARTSEASASRRVIIRLAAVLRRIDDNRILWRNNSLEEHNTYVVSDQQDVDDVSFNDALTKAAEDLASKLLNSMLEGF